MKLIKAAEKYIDGVIYQEDGSIVSECESDDLDVAYWHELPKPPCC